MELYNYHIPIGNIYYMLSYAYQDLQEDRVVSVKPEEFENIHQLMAEIIILGVTYQLKKGLLCSYEGCREELALIRGKIDIPDTINTGSMLRRKLACSYDEYTDNTLMNRILKSVMLLLLRSEIKEEQMVKLRRLIRYFSNIELVDLFHVRWDTLVFTRNHGEYRLLMNLCRIICENMLQSTENGDVRLVSFSEEHMNRLYEKFILNYYKKHHSALDPGASHIKWDTETEVYTPDTLPPVYSKVNNSEKMLPKMKSDIILEHGNCSLIIDAKFYSNPTQSNFSKDTFRSPNLYQIFTYVKNYAARYKGQMVSGMLLYAKTWNEEDTGGIPDEGAAFTINGHIIAVRSLDLSGDFASIAGQLDGIVVDFFR